MPVDPRRRHVRTSLRSRWRAIVLLLVVETVTLAATAAAGSQPSEPTPIPKSAFRRVQVPPGPSSIAAPPGADAGADEAVPRSSAGLDEMRDFAFSSLPPSRAQPSLDAERPIVVPVPTPTPKPTPAPRLGDSLRGYASYYCRAGVSPCTVNYPDVGGVQAYGAAGPKLRAALGSGWRGSVVYVDGIRVKLIDWCQCYKGESSEKLIDLYYDVFSRTGSPVVIRW